jgi:hypothetical protein
MPVVHGAVASMPSWPTGGQLSPGRGTPRTDLLLGHLRSTCDSPDGERSDSRAVLLPAVFPDGGPGCARWRDECSGRPPVAGAGKFGQVCGQVNSHGNQAGTVGYRDGAQATRRPQPVPASTAPTTCRLAEGRPPQRAPGPESAIPRPGLRRSGSGRGSEWITTTGDPAIPPSRWCRRTHWAFHVKRAVSYG